MAMTLLEAQGALAPLGREDVAFDVLGAVSRGSAMPGERDDARDLLIRTLEHRDELPQPLQYLLSALVREQGPVTTEVCPVSVVA
jgi:hypothetical protein